MFDQKEFEEPTMEENIKWISYNLKKLADLFEVYLDSINVVKGDKKRNKYLREK